MDEQPNLQRIPQRSQQLQRGGSAAAPAKAAPARRCRPIGKVVEIAGSGSQIRIDAAALAALQAHKRPVGRHVRPGRQPGQDGRRQQLADRQRPHACAPARPANSSPTSTSSAKAAAIRPAGMSNFRRGVTRYPIPGAEVLPVTHRGPALDLRRQRRAAHRDRHRLPDRRHPRRALRRPDAVEAFRGAGIDRYR